MAAANRQGVGVAHARTAHPEEWSSILMAVNHFAWALPGWIAGAYLVVQMLFLLMSARHKSERWEF